MNTKKSRPTLRTPHSKNRCNFAFADGRRCRMLRHQTSGELCLFHNREFLQLQSAAEIGAELLALGGNFQNPIAINFVLGKLFAHVATGRMHRRDASTLAYIAQLLLQTLDEKRYTQARDQYDYRGWTQAVDTKYGRPKPNPAAPTKTSAPNSSPSSVAAGLQSRPASNSVTTPTSATPNVAPQPVKYPPPANPEFPEALPDTLWLREVFLAKRANAQQQPHPPTHP